MCQEHKGMYLRGTTKAAPSEADRFANNATGKGDANNALLLKDRICADSEPESPEGSGSPRDNDFAEMDVQNDFSPVPEGTVAGGHDYYSEVVSSSHSSIHETGHIAAPLTFSGLHMNFVRELSSPSTDDIIDRGIISLDDAEQLVAFFIRKLASTFPLVVLPSNTTAAQLRESKPVLFLAVISAASISLDASLAGVLNREIVRLYSERFFVEGEKSLELVQALLLMTIFYLPPDSPLKLQFYQYTHIACTMALEIGLATKRRVSRNHSSREDKYKPHDEPLAEQARAILGCYYLGSIVAMKTGRSNLLQSNDWMTECVVHLEKSSHPTDRVLAVWFELQRITDEATSSFGLDDTTPTTPLTEARVQAVLRWFDKRMEL